MDARTIVARRLRLHRNRGEHAYAKQILEFFNREESEHAKKAKAGATGDDDDDDPRLLSIHEIGLPERLAGFIEAAGVWFVGELAGWTAG